MTEECQAGANQLKNKLIPSFALQSVSYWEKFQWSPGFISLMFKDIEDAFNEQPPEGESNCDCC